MAECFDKKMLQTVKGDFTLKEIVEYSNIARSYFYIHEDTVIIIDDGICYSYKNTLFEYRRLTNKQNEYMNAYKHLYRFLIEDIEQIDLFLKSDEEISFEFNSTLDRNDFAEATPLEYDFEKRFIDVYGADSAKYLWKEYGITDTKGNVKFLDYYFKTEYQEIAVEENGVHYHHPQIIGIEKYREQLLKQNICTRRGIKLFRFSSQDLKFENQMQDDLKSFFGNKKFEVKGTLVNRSVALYEHQKITLQDIYESREKGIKSFLIVYPTGSGKSKIVEEDMQNYFAEYSTAKFLILVPNTTIKIDWESRISFFKESLKSKISIFTYSYICRHYSEYDSTYFSYIAVDEAHHAMAPELKRVIQYFNPNFLVGMTATDERFDKKKLENVFGAYQVGLSLKEAMEKGIVARTNVYRIETNINLSEIRINGKDYVNADLEKSISVTSRNQLIVDVLKRYFCKGSEGALNNFDERQGVIFCVSVKHADEMKQLLCAAGISAESFSSKTKNPKLVMEKFKNKSIRFLCSCQMISEGWDYPELGILVMARPTLSKVLYLQQLGRGLRKTPSKENIIVIDVVDEYGCIVSPCSMHSIFHNPFYVPFGDVLRSYQPGDFITVDWLTERVERIVPVNTESFDDKYKDYFSKEQLAREYFISTGTLSSWIKSNKIIPTISFPFGKEIIHLFSPDDVEKFRKILNIGIHNDTTIKKDFFDFLENRDYTMSYKMPFLLGFLEYMNENGEAKIDDVLKFYTDFYKERLSKGLPADKKPSPFDHPEFIGDLKKVKENMLKNPFEKFERKRFMHYSKDLEVITMNHALHSQLQKSDLQRIKSQMLKDLEDYWKIK